MRLDPKLVHPSIFKATDAYTFSSGVGSDPKVVVAHQEQWFREKGLAFVGSIFGAAALIGIVVSLMEMHGADRHLRLLAVFLLMGAMLAAGAFAFRRNMRRLTAAELDTLLPALDLSEAGRAYGETIVALHRSGRSAQEVGETMAALNALLDDEARLEALRGAIVGQGAQDRRSTLEAERAELARKAETTGDAGAREAYQQSVALLDERIAGLGDAEASLERVEAHLSLLRQAVFATRDAARRLASTPALGVPDLANDSLRAAVALARAQTTETERALAELRAI